MTVFLRVHGILPQSRVNGPGQRSVVHLQGCSLACKGCFNPESHSAESGTQYTAFELAQILAKHAVDGVTISGGEPFQQVPGLVALLRALREHSVQSVVVFTGYTLDELHEEQGAVEALELIDLLVAGRYDASTATHGTMLASENQRLHFLSTVYGPGDVSDQTGEVEITITPDGTVTMTGFPPANLRRAVRNLGD